MTPSEWFLLAIVCFFFFVFIRIRGSIEKDRQFRKNLKVGDKAHFWVDGEHYIGKIKNVHPPFVDFDYFNSTHTVFISSIYPA